MLRCISYIQQKSEFCVFVHPFWWSVSLLRSFVLRVIKDQCLLISGFVFVGLPLLFNSDVNLFSGVLLGLVNLFRLKFSF